jgi:single-strand DNA-binding protein
MRINKAILIGNVGKNPDIRHLDGGSSVATFSLATTEKGYTLANGTQVPDRTEWHNIVAWKGLAKIAESYIKKALRFMSKARSRHEVGRKTESPAFPQRSSLKTSSS